MLLFWKGTDPDPTFDIDNDPDVAMIWQRSGSRPDSALMVIWHRTDIDSNSVPELDPIDRDPDQKHGHLFS